MANADRNQAAEAQPLEHLTIEPKGGGFEMQIEDAAGGALAVTATEEQLDILADRIDDLLGADPGDEDDARV